ncbi:Kv channel-interacting protein 1 [Penaeus vannamei]|uniref:Kv channel-interacting protein 1 n=1 Tax=Penaeus vannamei TaxID=6689 RepID=A0A423T9P7_PENVA|nr:Kv channel-interacting protein 1 [Penaeus vannamei]
MSSDLLVSLSQLLRGNAYDKLKFAFKLYDVNGDGCITKAELTDIVSSVHELMGRCSHNRHVEDKQTREHVERLFKKLDLNGDGVVTIDEFLQSCMQQGKRDLRGLGVRRSQPSKETRRARAKARFELAKAPAERQPVAKSERNLLRTNTYLHGKSCKSSRVVLPDARCARFELFFVSIGATDSCFGRRAIGRTAARHGPLPPGERTGRRDFRHRCEEKTTPFRDAGPRSRCDAFLVVSSAPLSLELAACPSLVRRRPPSGSTGQQTACEGARLGRPAGDSSL